MKIHRFLLTLSIVVLRAPSVYSCSSLVANLRTDFLPAPLCELSDRFEQLKIKLRKKGVKIPERMAEALAPRFINGPDWQVAKQNGQYNPWFIYSPQPQTWKSWEIGQTLVLAKLQENLKNHRVAPLSLDWIKEMHAQAMKGLNPTPGVWRTQPEVGYALYVRKGLSPEEQLQVRNGAGYRLSSDPNSPLFTWKPMLCFEHLPEKLHRKFEDETGKKIYWVDTEEWPSVPMEQFFHDESNQQRQCGYLVYADPKFVEAELAYWLKSTNENLRAWTGGQVYTDGAIVDPLLAIARTQRWFIGIHPFTKGNGRISRNIVDLLVQSLGLPPPIFENMDEDVYTTEAAWAEKLGQAILRTLSVYEACLTDLRQKECQTISVNTPRQR